MNLRVIGRLPALLLFLAIALAGSGTVAAQDTTKARDLPLPQLPPGMTPQQAVDLAKQRPELAAQVRTRIAESGLTPEQIRARLRAAGYPETLLDDFLTGADPAAAPRPGSNVLEAMRTLGIASSATIDTLRELTDSARAVADSLRADSLRTDSKALRIFGLDIFRKVTTQFQPAMAGPVDARYTLGPGDGLLLTLSGDVEAAYPLEVNRDGAIVIPTVGTLRVANLTMAQLEDLLYARLSRVYSGVRREGGTTRFDATVTRQRTVQVFVIGDVARPGAYQVSASGTALTALYAAGGPTERGSFRQVIVRRGTARADTVDLYDYLTQGLAERDAPLRTGDVVFVPPVQNRVKVTGAVVRPAIYELRTGETLADLIATAGGFAPAALRSTVQIHRILPPTERVAERDRIVVSVQGDPLASNAPRFDVVAGDSVVVFEVRDRVRSVVQVLGNVWKPGPVGHRPGMRLSEALLLAGNPRPDAFLGSVLVSRVRADSSRAQFRSAFADSTWRLTDDLVLQEDDEIEVFSRTTFRAERYVVVTGAVRKPGRVLYREGMTIRDALLLVDGLTEDAFLAEAEIARLPAERRPGQIASTYRVPLDSTYLFERRADGTYAGPPGLPALRSGAPEVELQPYDNVLILRQPEWELQRLASITGAVKFPGTYGLTTRSDRLTDLLARAGGLTAEAYPAGVEFYRQQGRLGRVGVDLPKVLKDPKERDNLLLIAGDSIHIPEYNPIVRVGGAVNAPVAVSYVPGKDASYYINAAGGFSRKADSKRTYVTQPSGKVQAGRSVKPLAGGSVFVPEKDPNDRSNFLQVFGTLAPVLASLATVLVVALQN